MKKFLCSVMLCVVVMMGMGMPIEAMSAQTISRGDRWETLMISLYDLARKIIANNKPAFEQTLTKSERTIEGWDSGVFYFRVWAKDTTIVVGSGDKKKKFYPDYIQMRDPEMIFVGGIRVGASVNVLEKFFGASLKQLTQDAIEVGGKPQNGEILFLPENDVDPCVRILHKDGKITEIESFSNDMDRPAFTKKVEAFVRQRKIEMSLAKGWL